LPFCLKNYKTKTVMKKNYFLTIVAILVTFFANAQPATPAPTPPARNASDVLSIYSGAYASLTGVNFNPDWGQSGFATATTFTLSGDEMRFYPNMNYQGVDFGTSINASNMTHVHFDIWTPTSGGTATNFEFFLISPSPTQEQSFAVTPTAGSWTSVDIPLTNFPNVRLHNLFQLKFVATPFGTSSIYIDNIYFYKAANVPTITNFSIPTKTVGDAPFAITPPTSNSAGAFTYTSSNTAVATVSGNIITVVGAGTSTILATQAANGGFVQGQISTTFTVNAAMSSPNVNAPNPTKPSADVISLFSDVYTNVPVDTWRTGWSDATLTDENISGNNIKKYANLNFVGIEFHSPGPKINANTMDTFHISVWTANATKFRVKLVDFGANDAFGGGDDTEAEIWFTSDPADASLPNRYGAAPVQGQWNNYSIPLSFFTSNGLANRNKLSQLILSAAVPGANTVFVDNIYFSAQSSLPVNFKSFDIVKDSKSALLKWTVANEVNLQEYAVQKSTNGRDYSTIAVIEAKGNSVYSATDENLANGINYYRIKAIDKDGSYQYSVTKSITHSKNGKVPYSVYPNPAVNEIKIANLVGNTQISIMDVAGRVVLRRNNITNAITSIDIAHLTNGIYAIVISNEVETQTIKLVVNK
jgi:hypothetical protein